MVSLVSYNSQCASWTARLFKILTTIAAHVIALQGTKVERHLAQPDHYQYYTLEAKNYSVVQWPAGPTSEFTNPSTGVTIAINKAYVHSKFRTDIFSPPPHLQGRGGAVLYLKDSFALFVCDLYFPASGTAALRFEASGSRFIAMTSALSFAGMRSRVISSLRESLALVGTAEYGALCKQGRVGNACPPFIKTTSPAHVERSLETTCWFHADIFSLSWMSSCGRPFRTSERVARASESAARVRRTHGRGPSE